MASSRNVVVVVISAVIVLGVELEAHLAARRSCWESRSQNKGLDRRIEVVSEDQARGSGRGCRGSPPPVCSATSSCNPGCSFRDNGNNRMRPTAGRDLSSGLGCDRPSRKGAKGPISASWRRRGRSGDRLMDHALRPIALGPMLRDSDGRIPGRCQSRLTVPPLRQVRAVRKSCHRGPSPRVDPARNHRARRHGGSLPSDQ